MDVGLRTEAIITAELLRRGVPVLVPCGFNHRYDLVLDLEGEFLRVQCKTGRLRQGAIRFKCASVMANTRRSVARSYQGEVELFLVYCKETDGIYAVPVADVPMSEMLLRVEPTGNRQAKGVRWASDYLLPA